MKYKATVYRNLTQSIEIEVEAPWQAPWHPDLRRIVAVEPHTPSKEGKPDLLYEKEWVKMTAEDIAAEESDHDWKDEGWEFDEGNFQAVPMEDS